MNLTLVLYSLLSLFSAFSGKYLCTRKTILRVSNFNYNKYSRDKISVSIEMDVTEELVDRFETVINSSSYKIKEDNLMVDRSEVEGYVDINGLHFVYTSNLKEGLNVETHIGTAELGLTKSDFHFYSGGYNTHELNGLSYNMDNHECTMEGPALQFSSAKIINKNEKYNNYLQIDITLNENQLPYKIADLNNKVHPYFDEELEQLASHFNFGKLKFYSLGD